MIIDTDTLEKLATLARLDVAAETTSSVKGDLERILDLVTAMQALDTSEVTPLGHPRDATQRLREDRITETDQREQLQAPAREVENGVYLVPKVLD